MVVPLVHAWVEQQQQHHQQQVRTGGIWQEVFTFAVVVVALLAPVLCFVLLGGRQQRRGAHCMLWAPWRPATLGSSTGTSVVALGAAAGLAPSNVHQLHQQLLPVQATACCFNGVSGQLTAAPANAGFW